MTTLIHQECLAIEVDSVVVVGGGGEGVGGVEERTIIF